MGSGNKVNHKNVFIDNVKSQRILIFDWICQEAFSKIKENRFKRKRHQIKLAQYVIKFKLVQFF
jgi:hypothetical protein